MTSKLGCSGGISTCILIFLNIIFLIIGIALFAAGIVVKFDLLQKYLQPLIDEILPEIPSLAVGASVNDPQSMTGTVKIDIFGVLDPIGIALICIGVFIIIVASLGCCGACCNVRCMLMTYAVIVVVLLLIQIIVIVIICVGAINSKIQGEIKKLIDREYGGIDTFEAISLAINYIMFEFACCGVFDYNDFATATKWQRSRNITLSDGGTSLTFELNLVTPVACCKLDGPFPGGMPLNSNCSITPNDNTSNWKTGCWDKVASRIGGDNLALFVGITVGICLFELIVSICACILFYKAGQ